MAGTSRTAFTPKKDSQGFSRLTDALEIRRYVSRAIETAASVDVRLIQPDLRFSSKIAASSDPKRGIEIEIPEKDRIELTQAQTRTAPVKTESLIIVFLRGQTLLCLRSAEASWDGRTLQILPPWDVFRLQRRKEARLEIPAAYEIFATIDAIEGQRRRVQKKVIDISPSGLGFQVLSPREAGLFKKGLFLKKMTLVIEGREIVLDGQVRSALPIKNGLQKSGVKIGVQFVRIQPLDARFIASYVARNLAQFQT